MGFSENDIDEAEFIHQVMCWKTCCVSDNHHDGSMGPWDSTAGICKNWADPTVDEKASVFNGKPPFFTVMGKSTIHGNFP